MEDRIVPAVVAPGGLRAIPAAFTFVLPSDIQAQVNDVLGAGGPGDAMLYAALPGETNNVVVTSSYFDFFLQADDDPSVPILRIPPVFNRAFFDSLGAISASITIEFGGEGEIGADGEGGVSGGLAVANIEGALGILGTLGISIAPSLSLGTTVPLTEILGGLPEPRAIVPNPLALAQILDFAGLGSAIDAL